MSWGVGGMLGSLTGEDRSSKGGAQAGSPCVLRMGQGKEPEKEARFGLSILSIIRRCVTSFT